MPSSLPWANVSLYDLLTLTLIDIDSVNYSLYSSGYLTPNLTFQFFASYESCKYYRDTIWKPLTGIETWTNSVSATWQLKNVKYDSCFKLEVHRVQTPVILQLNLIQCSAWDSELLSSIVEWQGLTVPPCLYLVTPPATGGCKYRMWGYQVDAHHTCQCDIYCHQFMDSSKKNRSVLIHLIDSVANGQVQTEKYRDEKLFIVRKIFRCGGLNRLSLGLFHRSDFQESASG